jgi:hypothetical protein
MSWNIVVLKRTALFRGSMYMYSKTCEIRTPLGRARSVPYAEVCSFHSAICTENSSLALDEESLFHRMSSFRRVATHRFHCISNLLFTEKGGIDIEMRFVCDCIHVRNWWKSCLLTLYLCESCSFFILKKKQKQKHYPSWWKYLYMKLFCNVIKQWR